MSRRPAIPIRRTRADEEAAARPAADHAALAAGVVLVGHPLPDVAAHVLGPVRAGAAGVRPNVHRVTRVLAGARPFTFEAAPVGLDAVGVVPPRVLAPVGAAGRLFPL